MNRVFKIFFVLTSFVICSCASIQKSWQDQNCNHEAAYENGMNDALGRKSMHSTASSCPVEAQEAARAGYQEGFNQGLRTIESSTPGPSLNINIGGHGQNGSNRAWFCEVEVFAKRFEAFGATEIEARQELKHRCSAEFNPMHCEDADCRPNR